MKKILYLMMALITIFGCTKSTIKNNGCGDPPLTGDLCLPNVFSPNGDNINDSLFVRQSPGHPQVVTLEFKVIDAVGTVMFSTTDPALGWSGMYNGTIQSGIYKTEVHASMSNGATIDFNGTITCLAERPKTHIINKCTDCRFDSQFDGDGNFDASLPTNETIDICN